MLFQNKNPVICYRPARTMLCYAILYYTILGFTGVSSSQLIDYRTQIKNKPTYYTYAASNYTTNSHTCGIQEASNAATAAGGGTVLLSSGICEPTLHIVLASNVTYQGEGAGTVIKPVSYGNTSPWQHNYASPSAVGIDIFITPEAGAVNVVVKGILFDLQSVFTTPTFSTTIALYNCTNCKVEGVFIKNAQATGPPIAVLGNSVDNTITKTSIVGTATDGCSGGIFVQGTGHVISDNYAADQCDDSYVANDSTTSNIRFSNNYCTNNSGFTCYHAEGGNHIDFNGDVCDGASTCFNISHGSQYITLRGVRGTNAGHGVIIWDGNTSQAFSDITITGSTFHDLAQAGVHITYSGSRVNISNNTIYNTGQDNSDDWPCIWVKHYANGVTPLDGLNITGNNLYNCGALGRTHQGIAFLPYSTEAAASNVVISNNIIQNTTSGGSRVQTYGIRVRCVSCAQYTLKNWVISNNTVKNHPSANIFLDGFAVEDFQNSVIGPNSTDDSENNKTYYVKAGKRVELPSYTCAALIAELSYPDTAPNGSVVYCSDCKSSVPITCSGTGAVAKKENSAWNSGASSVIDWVSGITSKPFIDIRTFTGVDSTGATDSSVGIQAAVDSIKTTTGGTLFFPSGTYLIGSQINIVSSSGSGGKQVWFRCAEPGTTTIYIPNSFSLANDGVFYWSNATGLYDSGGGMENCTFKYQQPDSTTFSDMIQYPPVIYDAGTTMLNLNKNIFVGAWVAVKGTIVNGLVMQNNKASCFSVCISIDRSNDIVTIDNFHQLFHGLTLNQVTAMTSVSSSSSGINIGRVSGFNLSNSGFYTSGYVFYQHVASDGTYTDSANISSSWFDGSGNVKISDGVANFVGIKQQIDPSHSDATLAGWEISGNAQVTVNGINIIASGNVTQPLFRFQPSRAATGIIGVPFLKVLNAQVYNDVDVNIFYAKGITPLASSAQMVLENISIFRPEALARSACVINQDVPTGGDVLVEVNNLHLIKLVTGTGCVAGIGTDNFHKFGRVYAEGGWTASIAGTGSPDLGDLGHNTFSWSLGYATIASGNTITVNGSNLLWISGNTVIKTINGGKPGQTIKFVFIHATPLGFDATGNVRVARVPAQYETVTLTLMPDGKWY